MDVSGIGWSTETEQASWIGPRLDRFGAGTVTSVVPSGFAAYARLLHPAESFRQGRSRVVRWSEVAAWSGVPLTRQAQFPDIALPEYVPPDPAPWDHGPEEGTLDGQDAAVLVELLRQYTTTPDRCWFCLWDGYGWDNTTMFLVSEDATAADPPGPADAAPQCVPDWAGDPVPGWVRAGPRVRLPGRDYLLYAGEVSAALALVEDKQQTPNLWWPADRSWCVASEIDLPWTYLAGSTALIDAVLADPRLEALPADPEDTVVFRVPEWVTEVVEPAVSDVLEHGTATVTTPWGTVCASLRHPTRGQSGWLSTSSENVNGSTGSGSIVEQTSEEELRSRIASSLAGAVTNFAGH